MGQEGAGLAQDVPIRGNDYTLEVFNGPVLSNTRVTGFAGANAAFGDGLDGASVNTAAPAIRATSSLRFVDYDASVGISLPGSFGASDYQNRGDRGSAAALDRTRQFLQLSGGFGLQIGHFGTAATIDVLRYTISGTDENPLRSVFAKTGPGLTLNFARIGIKAAYSFHDDQLAVGVGARIVAMGYDQLIGSRDGLFGFLGAAPEVGLVAMPKAQPYRLAVTFRAPVVASPLAENAAPGAVERVAGYAVPGRIVAPWELEAGVALQFGRRPLNIPWTDPRGARDFARQQVNQARAEREKYPLPPDAEAARRSVEEQYIDARYEEEIRARRQEARRLPREKLLVLASVLVSGSSGDATSVIGFVDQVRDHAGMSVTYSPRVGLEVEPIYDLLRVRTGSYLEPSRFPEGVSRQHFTFGGDIHLGRIPPILFMPELDLCFNAAVDVAPRFANIGGFICIWR